MGLIFGVFALLIILVLPANRPPAPVLVTVKNDPPPAAPRQERREKTCPDCAEKVLVDAKVCRHCGYRFDGAGEVKALPSPTDLPAYQREHFPAVAVLKATVAAAEPVNLAHLSAIVEYVVRREGWKNPSNTQLADLRHWIGTVPYDATALRSALEELRISGPRVKDAALDAVEGIVAGTTSGDTARQARFAQQLRTILA